MMRNMQRFSADHIAFLRGLLQGVPPERLWTAYMTLLEGPWEDARLVRRMAADIRHALSRIAMRAGKPGTARLLKLDLRPAEPNSAPTLEEFAQEFGLEDESEQEQLAAYEARYGRPDKRLIARGRLIKRQLRVINDLVDHAAAPPKPEDPVRAWLPDAVAGRLEGAGIMTLYSLASRMQRSKRWWSGIPGIGETKARRLQDWLAENGLLSAVRDLAVSGSPRAVVHLAEEGENRRSDSNLLGAPSDLHAVRAWLDGRSEHTLRAYRREAERLLLWAAIARARPLSGLTRDDILAYVDFLRDPQPESQWCAPRHTPRHSPVWRPFEGPLSPAAIDHAVSVLSGLFEFLVSTGYLKGNPATGIPRQNKRSLRRQFGARLLTSKQWHALRQAIDEGTPRGRRLGLIFDMLYASGLRLSELAAARFSHLQSMDDDDGESGWLLQVVGKGGKFREVPIPPEIIDRAWELARARGVQDQEMPASEAFLIGLVSGAMGRGEFDPMAPAGATTVAQEIDRHARQTARALIESSPEDARRIEKMSAHWLRHTHASHALESGVDLTAVQANLGHSSLSTTSVYVSAEQKRRMRQMRNFWKTAA